MPVSVASEKLWISVLTGSPKSCGLRQRGNVSFSKVEVLSAISPTAAEYPRVLGRPNSHFDDRVLEVSAFRLI